jgi:hypothetical protein
MVEVVVIDLEVDSTCADGIKISCAVFRYSAAAKSSIDTSPDDMCSGAVEIAMASLLYTAAERKRSLMAAISLQRAYHL